jgi:hypothetical protein
MGFSVFVEILNLAVRRRTSEPVRLHSPYGDADGAPS